MKALPKRKGNALEGVVQLEGASASMKALPKRKGNTALEPNCSAVA